MSIFRSEEMVRSQLYLPLDAAYATVSELGELGLVQFKDYNVNVNAFQRKFVNEIRRCDEMERKIRYIEKEISNYPHIDIHEPGDNPRAPYPREIIDLEATFERLEGELREVNTNALALNKNFVELTELREVLARAQKFFAQQRRESLHNLMDDTTPLERIERSTPADLQLGFVSGVIRRDKLAAFERILWFACRGNVFLRIDDNTIFIKDTQSGEYIQKVVFIIFFQGDQLKSRVRKICDGYRATLYPVSEDQKERSDMLTGVTARIAELLHVLEQTESHRERVLRNASNELHNWMVKVRKIKAIYHTMNQCNFDMSRNSLIAEIWSPANAFTAINNCLISGAELSGSTIPPIMHRIHTLETPPTYYANNKLTKGFQAIINAYGVANYREINPALYTVISFPFLFAIMFGDAGHGLLMFLFALAMVVNEKKLAAMRDMSETYRMFFSGRYIVLLMGAFSMYTGLMYNDAYSKSLNIFGTAFHSNYSLSTISYFQGNDDKPTEFQIDPVTAYRGYPYPFGMDPIWQLAEASTKITYLNSLKMKLAIIVGVSQMVFGLFLSLLNKIYFREYSRVLFEFLPEILFLLSIFGYLAILLIYKWLSWDAATSKEAPALLIQFINMFMFNYNTDPSTPIPQQPFSPNQKTIQTLLVVIAGISAPWLLLSKPIYLLIKHKSGQKNKYVRQVDDTASSPESETEKEEVVLQPIADEMRNGGGALSSDEKSSEESEFAFGDIIIHQVIHTIEFCLNCVSHTASYLRLWALSLAHAELSEVFWTMVLRRGLGMDSTIGFVMIFLTWIVWAFITIGVLLLMEGLSAFLHALRLHWVEFQSKFYGGEGYLFLPFTFQHIHEMVLETSQ